MAKEMSSKFQPQEEAGKYLNRLIQAVFHSNRRSKR